MYSSLGADLFWNQYLFSLVLKHIDGFIASVFSFSFRFVNSNANPLESWFNFIIGHSLTKNKDNRNCIILWEFSYVSLISEQRHNVPNELLELHIQRWYRRIFTQIGLDYIIVFVVSVIYSLLFWRGWRFSLHRFSPWCQRTTLLIKHHNWPYLLKWTKII